MGVVTVIEGWRTEVEAIRITRKINLIQQLGPRDASIDLCLAKVASATQPATSTTYYFELYCKILCCIATDFRF